MRDLVYTCRSDAKPDDVTKCYDESVSYVYETDIGGDSIYPPYRFVANFCAFLFDYKLKHIFNN